MIKIVSTQFFPEKIREKFAQIPEFDLQYLPLEELNSLTDIEALIIDSFIFDEKFLKNNPALKIIINLGKELSPQQSELIKNRQITIYHAPAAKANAVAEYVLMMIVALSRNLPLNLNRRERIEGNEISEKILGLIGLGETGLQTANLARKFNLSIIYHDKEKKNCSPAFISASRDEVFAQADFISIHLPSALPDDQIISAKDFQQIKKPIILINPSGLRLVNLNDLSKAFSNKKIKAAVFDLEPGEELPVEFKTEQRIFTTPGIASFTAETIERSAIEILKLLKDFFNV